MAENAPVSVLFPNADPAGGAHRIDLPPMSPDEQATLLRELGVLGASNAALKAHVDARFTELERRQDELREEVRDQRASAQERADESGTHERVMLQKALDDERAARKAEQAAREASSSRWKWWALGIVAALATNGVSAAAAYWIATR